MCVSHVQCVRVESPAPSQFYNSLLCTDSCHSSQVGESHSAWRHAWCRVRGTSNSFSLLRMAHQDVTVCVCTFITEDQSVPHDFGRD